MASLKDVCKKVGLHSLKVEKGATSVDVMPLVEALFEEINEMCRNGEKVGINNFGTFQARVIKGRTLQTPLAPEGEFKFGDMLIMKFRQASKAKNRLNEGKNVENFGGTYIEKKPRPSDLRKAEAKKNKEKKSEEKKSEGGEKAPKKANKTKAPKKVNKEVSGKKPTSKKKVKKAPPAKEPVKE
jgi:nucleoid DNA-binding protein